MTTEPNADTIIARCEYLDRGSLRRAIVDAALAHKRGEYLPDMTAADAVRAAASQLALTAAGEAIIAGVTRPAEVAP